MPELRTKGGFRLFDPEKTQRTPFIAAVEGSPLALRASVLPSSVDFSDLVTIGNQGQRGDCTAWGITGAYEVGRKVDNYPASPSDFAKTWLYGMEDIREGHPGTDEGAQPQDGLAIGQTYGFLPASLYPETDAIPTAPTQAQLQAAAQYRLKSWAPVARVASTDPRTALVSVLDLLAQKRPLVIAVLVHDSFENSNGIIPMPGNASTDPLAGGHCMFLCGYKDDPSFPGGGYVKAANSWSTAWGQPSGGKPGGFALIPYAYAYDGPLTIGLWDMTLPALAPVVTPPATVPIQIEGVTAAFPAYPDLLPGSYLAPAVDLAKALGWNATRDTKGVYLTKPKIGLLARLFGRA